MTQDEIRLLIELQNSEEQKNPAIFSRYLDYDNDIVDMFKTFCKKRLNQDYDEEIDGLIQDLAVVITKLKFAYQRPRPFQLAQYYKARLFPVISLVAISPSYPSGHTIEARVMAELIGSRHPEQYEFLIRLADDIAQSRLFLGLHYPSDNDFSLIVAKAIYTSKEFTTKYGL
jgi:membrane-associated phospholipid phosphatase